MAKRRRPGLASSSRTPASLKVASPNWKTPLFIFLALSLAALPFAYGKYLEFGTNDAYDSGLNVYDAHRILQGEKIGDTIFPSARPATLLVNIIGVGMFGYSETGPKLIQAVMQLTALGLMFYALWRLYGYGPATLALVLAAFYLSCPPYAKFGNVKEQYMIACMMVAASTLLLRQMGGRWGWILICGGAAINIYFFKPTGASFLAAMAIYLFARPLLKRQSWKALGVDLGGLVVGALIGLLPLIVLSVNQDNLKWLVNASPLKFVLNMSATPTQAAESVGKRQTPGTQSDAQTDTEAPGIFQSVVGKLFGSYVSSSHGATTFKSQAKRVFGYYKSFIVPIGFSLLVILQGLLCTGRWLTGWSRRRDDKLREEANGAPVALRDNAAFFFAIWWLLDMLFVWVSARGYVQYYLPLNASAAMLTAHALHKRDRRTAGVLSLLGLWLVLDVVFTAVTSEGFDTALTPKGFGRHMMIYAIPFVAVLILYIVLRRKRIRMPALVPLAALGTMLFAWNGDNLSMFQKRVGDLNNRQSPQVWEQIGHYLQDNSREDEGAYVWGWMPGIYVQARRYNPASKPAYGTMHTDSVCRVKAVVQKTVNELKNEPPRYIVDARKFHFPYYTHPNMDLWPRWRDKDRRKLYLEYHPQQPRPAIAHAFMSAAEFGLRQEAYFQQVEELTRQLLLAKHKSEGMLDEENARRQAQLEKQRHQALAPLRTYLMENYTPVPLKNAPMLVFRLK